jgi:hypothetical protein
VYEWVTQQVGEKSASLLRQEEVNGSSLMTQTEASLRDFGIAGGLATKLCLAVKSLHTSQQGQDMSLDCDFRVKMEAHEHLQQVWDEIGTSAADRQAYWSELSQHVQALYHNRVQEQKDSRDTCQEKIRGLQTCIEALCEQLRIEQPEPVSKAVPLLQQIAFLTAQLDVIKQEKERQQVRNGKALAELMQLYRVLGEPLPGDTHHLQLGSHRLAEIQALISQTHQKIADKKVLLETAKAKVYAELQDLMFQEDEYTPLDRLVLLDGSDIPLSALGELARRGVELEEINAERKERLKALARKIATIWNILNIPTEHRKEFMGGNAGLGRATFEKCERELADLEAQKRAQLPQLLEAAEIKLRGLWAETCTSQTEQDNFFESYLEMNNELKFVAIKQQILEVERRLEDMQSLLAGVQKREQIKAEEEMYTSLQSDPNRFKIAGLPLRLEQMRKNFQSFPKLAAKLRQEIEEWEAANGPFMRNGERLLATMEANGEFDEGFLPGTAEPRRTATLKAESTNLSRKAVHPATIPRSSRATPVKREESKYSSHSLPLATPSKKEASNLQSARKKVPTRKTERENHVERNENHGKASDIPNKHREKPSHEQVTPKRIRTPLKESNH